MYPPPPVVRRGVFRGSDVLRRGVLTRGQLRTSAYRRLRPDVYVLPRCRSRTACLHAEAVALVAPAGSAFGGPTAAALWGGEEFAGPTDHVEVLVPPGVCWHATSGVLVRTAPLAAALVSDGGSAGPIGRARPWTSSVAGRWTKR